MKNILSVEKIEKYYGNKGNITKAIDNISFKIEKGEIVGFLGRNGAGKTTTMNLITGLLKPTEGDIYIDSEPLSKKSRRKIGYMQENIPLYDELTVKEFINYMSELKGVKRQERIYETEQLIKNLNLLDVKNKLIRNISRGYKQRTSLAGALVGNPEILILDEPTVGLDPKQIIEIRNLIKSLRKKHTILLSSHILSEISQLCQKVIIIDNGKILAIDSPENLEKRINQNHIIVIVEDLQNNIENVKDRIEKIEKIKLIREIDSKTKEYEIYVEGKVDIRKELIRELSKENITLLELKSSEIKLEEVFMNLIDEKGGKTDVSGI